MRVLEDLHILTRQWVEYSQVQVFQLGFGGCRLPSNKAAERNEKRTVRGRRNEFPKLRLFYPPARHFLDSRAISSIRRERIDTRLKPRYFPPVVLLIPGIELIILGIRAKTNRFIAGESVAGSGRRGEESRRTGDSVAG